jgi:hypothetical protein
MDTSIIPVDTTMDNNDGLATHVAVKNDDNEPYLHHAR